jgi:ribosomal protein S18 acetylase RimI-like enzyme
MTARPPLAAPIWFPQLSVRFLRQDDLPALEWDGEFTHFRRLYTEIYEHFHQGRAVLWVAELPRAGIIGQLFVQLNSSRTELADGVERAYIYGFRIKPAYRGFGVGTHMLRVAENYLAAHKFRRVTLNVARDNHTARQLYEHLGYRVTGPDPGRWSFLDHHGRQQDVVEPAWRMEKTINQRERS